MRCMLYHAVEYIVNSDTHGCTRGAKRIGVLFSPRGMGCVICVCRICAWYRVVEYTGDSDTLGCAGGAWCTGVFSSS